MAGSIGLCLSGGGYRAMLFHTGTLWRLNELGWLSRLDRVSSVSGGSIAAGALAKAWPSLKFTDGIAVNLGAEVVTPLRKLASTGIDVGVVVRGLLRPWRSVGEELAAAYARHLYGDLHLTDLPADGPSFIFTATDLCDGSQWWFARQPGVTLATAVAASSAFPPFLSPVVTPDPRSDRDGKTVLSDAGVFDNLGLDAVVGQCETVLVSDAGKRMKNLRTVSRIWIHQMLRVSNVTDNQVRELRTGALLKSYVDGEFSGAYWGSYSDIENFKLADALAAPHEHTKKLAETRTRLTRFPPLLQERLINWGYAVCDAAMRRHVDTEAKAPAKFPFPGSGVG